MDRRTSLNVDGTVLKQNSPSGRGRTLSARSGSSPVLHGEEEAMRGIDHECPAPGPIGGIGVVGKNQMVWKGKEPIP